jgi:enamine deaminase RidA (YjgF/YER057c/UK114 family)
VYVSGQVSVDGEGGLVGEGDLAAQSIQTFGNVGRALASVGASWDDVARMTIYVVDFEPSMYEAMQAGREAALGSTLPCSTLLGVQALASPAYLIEVEAIAVLD